MECCGVGPFGGPWFDYNLDFPAVNSFYGVFYFILREAGDRVYRTARMRGGAEI